LLGSKICQPLILLHLLDQAEVEWDLHVGLFALFVHEHVSVVTLFITGHVRDGILVLAETLVLHLVEVEGLD